MQLATRIGTMAEICGCGLKVIAPLKNSITTGNNREIEVRCFSGLLEPNTFYVLVKTDAPILDNALLAFETDESASIKEKGIRYRSSAYNIFPVVSAGAYDCVVKTTWRYVAFSKSIGVGGGTKCLTPRRSYRRSLRSSARFCAHSHRWEVAA